jgi:hypothetical protein
VTLVEAVSFARHASVAVVKFPPEERSDPIPPRTTSEAVASGSIVHEIVAVALSSVTERIGEPTGGGDEQAVAQ